MAHSAKARRVGLYVHKGHKVYGPYSTVRMADAWVRFFNGQTNQVSSGDELDGMSFDKMKASHKYKFRARILANSTDNNFVKAGSYVAYAGVDTDGTMLVTSVRHAHELSGDDKIEAIGFIAGNFKPSLEFADIPNFDVELNGYGGSNQLSPASEKTSECYVALEGFSSMRSYLGNYENNNGSVANFVRKGQGININNAVAGEMWFDSLTENPAFTGNQRLDVGANAQYISEFSLITGSLYRTAFCNGLPVIDYSTAF